MNHAIVTSRKFFTETKLDAVIREINQRRFNGVFKVEKWNDVYWEIEHPTAEWRHKLMITIENRRRVELRKQIGGEFNHWLQTVFQEEIAKKFDGRCGDQGVHYKWAPKPSKYPHFRSMYEAMSSHSPIDQERAMFLEHFFCKLVDSLPDDLKQFAGP